MWDPEQEGVTREEEGPLVVPESRAPRFVSLQQAPIQPPLPPLPSPPLSSPLCWARPGVEEGTARVCGVTSVFRSSELVHAPLND